MANISPGWGSQWEIIANAINDYYGGGIASAQYQKVVQMLNSGEYTMQEMESILGNIPEFSRTYNANGELVKVSYKVSTSAPSTAGSIAHEINSNVANATKSQFSTAQTITKNPATGKVTIGDTVTKYSGGTAGTAKVIAGNVIAAVAAASAGIKIGKAIDQALYNANPDYWDSIGMWSLNPETWSTITAGENTLGATLFNFIFDIDPVTNDPTPYMDETTFAYMVAVMGQNGIIDGTGEDIWNEDTPQDFPENKVYAPLILAPHYKYIAPTGVVGQERELYYAGVTKQTNGSLILRVGVNFSTPVDDIKITSYEYPYGDAPKLGVIMCTKNPNHGQVIIQKNDINTLAFAGGGSGFTSSFTYDNKTVYYSRWVFPFTEDYYEGTGTNTLNHDNPQYVAWMMQYGEFEKENLPGISNQPGARIFDTSSISDYMDITAVLNALKNQYPELWENRVEISPDGETTVNYVPVGFPTGGTGNAPTTEGATQAQPAPQISEDGANATDELIKTIVNIIQYPQETTGMDSDTDIPPKPVDPNPPDTGTGDTPAVVVPTGSASALYSVYNPSQSELNSFGAWLWSTNFVDQLLKLFNDPMQAIIGLHKIFAPPSISGRGNIKVGYLDSGIATNLVDEQYVTVDCGSVSLSEYFGNVFDYDPHTQVYIYLPFIGIEKLDTGDVMRSTINVVYHIDVITGACLAEINVTRDLSGGTLYTFSGNCAVQYPVSSGSYMGIVASIASIAGGVVGTISSGGALAPMAMGAVSGVLNAHTRVNHSGGFSGNAGAMGIKKPYLIITRPQTCLADEFPKFEGYPANSSVLVSECTGYIECKAVHIENVPATDAELTEIENLLKSGVII